ncbi:coatomer subunit beta'-like isoform X2 [Sebastes umbrosus]|uniref:coatomer subunit beta'-like isoform X2 n=1 Tax=Sebastes umbrosus TaxID=72105 RepID=UPI00189F3FA9|nr:coatomer subunit beta'-like isoform X2 [Sebastes umbrosus]
MPLRLDIKRKLTARSDRVKSADLHPTEPWMVASLYSGTVVVWNHETQMMVKTFELCDLPVRVARFVARKHWVIAGADDMQIRVFNYNTLERVHMFEAHSDYIRCIVVHPTQPYILTSSDDMLIKLWDWDRKWSCGQVFEGHTHYVMQIVINPKDNNQFASASLDRTIKVWQLGSRTPNFTLEGHEKGVNCIDYYSGGDKPYLISGADDRMVKIWDYQNKTCVQTLEGHAQNVTCVSFHPELPIILTGSEDGTVRVWHSNTYRLENTLNYGMERVWCICGQPGSNSVALGYDEGSIIIKLGREEPAMSMDSSGKVMWARHSEVQQANLKAMGDAEIRDGERLPLGVKDMGSCEIFPQTIQHSPNGRFVVVCGDGEYIIYTAMALRNKSFGSAQEFVWAHDSSQYAVREGSSMVKLFKNFKEKKAFKPEFGAEGIFGGFLLGVRSNSGLAFYDWETGELIRRIEIQPKHIFWSDSGELVCIGTDESFFVLRYLQERVAAAQESKEEITEDGIEGAFEVLGEVPGVVKTGVWVGDCFIYTSSLNRLNYYVGGEIITIAHLDRTMYLLGYIPKDDRLYLGDKELNVISYSLLLSVLEYQTAVMRRDFSTADKVLPTIPKEQRTRVANFLEKQGFRQQALAVSTDPEHKFELALQLGELKIAHQLASEAESEQKWKQLAELATTKCQFSLAQECLHQAQDYGGLLLLATASGNADMVGKLAEGAEKDGKTNVAFLTYFLQGRLDKCLELLIETNRLPEAAFLARTYLPSHVSRVVKLWKESLSKVNKKAADALADPSQYSNLFPGLQQALLAEEYLKESHVVVRPAAEYPLIMPNEDRHVLEESAGFASKGEITGPEGEVKSISESVMVAAAAAAVTEAPPPETAVVEEPVLLKQEVIDPVSATEEEESIPPAASPLPVTVTEEPQRAESVSSEEDTITKPEEASVSVQEDIAESTTEVAPGEPEMVQFSLVENVKSSVETDVQEAADAAPAACISETYLIETSETITTTTSETITTTGETLSETVATETIATEDVLVSTDLIVDTDVMESVPVYEGLETDIISWEAPTIVDTAAEETHVTEELVSETAALPAAVEELISFENTASPVQHVLAQIPTFADFSFDPLLDPLQDTMPALKPVSAQEPEQEEPTTALPVKPEENLEPAVLLQVEPEVLSPVKSNVKEEEEEEEEEAGPEGAAQDLDADIDEGLDDLDLDNFDLEDIDTTDVNLDEDFLSE